MKLRLTQNSIRIRVRKSDLHKLMSEGAVLESICFGQAYWTFMLKTDPGLESASAVLHDGQIGVVLPEAMAKKWTQTDQVGIEVTKTYKSGESLHLLIEKDFPCVDREDEDKTDTFWELASEEPDAC